jgi:hypothetical protein
VALRGPGEGEEDRRQRGGGDDVVPRPAVFSFLVVAFYQRVFRINPQTTPTRVSVVRRFPLGVVRAGLRFLRTNEQGDSRPSHCTCTHARRMRLRAQSRSAEPA